MYKKSAAQEVVLGYSVFFDLKKGTPMNIDYDSLFCFVDDFCKGFENWYKKTLITSGIRKRNKPCKLTLLNITRVLGNDPLLALTYSIKCYCLMNLCW